MEEQKLVLQDGTYKYDDSTRQVSVSEEQLKKAGYVKLADDERMVKMVKLDQKKTKFMFENGCLPFYNPTSVYSFWHKAFEYSQYDGGEPEEVQALLAEAYFNGYVAEEPKYYIEFPTWQTYEEDKAYLNVYKVDGKWVIDTKNQVGGVQTQFTQAKIDELQKDERAKGIDFNAIKVKVPDGELAD